MPKASRATDRRRSGRGDNITGVNRLKSNMQDQRTKGKYSPGVESTPSAFAAGAKASKPATAGVKAGSAKKRAAPAVRKLGEKK